jgi:uncharacterized protein (DUF427 family)
MPISVDTPAGARLVWEDVPERVRVRFGGETIADSTSAKLLHESNHRPVYYVPLEDVREDLLEPSERTSHCPHKGDARYWTIRTGSATAQDAVWAYPEPFEFSSFLAGHVAFYRDRIDELVLGD